MNDNDDFGPVPAWLQAASAQWEAIDAARKTPLAQCQESVAQLRTALLAAQAILDRAGLHAAATAAFHAANASTPSDRQAAIRRLEEDAGYIAGTEGGECYP